MLILLGVPQWLGLVEGLWAEVSGPVLTLLAVYCMLVAHVVCRLLLSWLPWCGEWIAIT